MTSRLERWIFGPGDPRRLAALRIGLCSLLAARLSRPVYAGLADQPRALYRPISFMHAVPGMPPRGVVLAVQVAGVVAAVLAALGVRARPALFLAWACALFLDGMTASTGKVVHNDVMLLLALVPLLAAPVSDAWSFDSLRRKDPAEPGVRYGWPLRAAMVVVAGGYFFSGLAKLAFSGPAWVTSDNLRWVLYAASDAQRAPNAMGLFIAGHPWLAHLLAGVTLALELGFPLVLWRPRLAWVFVPGVIAMHLAIRLTMHLDYSAWALTAVVVFVDWPALLDRFRARVPAGVAPRRDPVL